MTYTTATQHKMDIRIVLEPNKKRVKGAEWLKDKKVNVAVLFVTKNIQIIGHCAGHGHLLVGLEGLDIMCCYVSPNVRMRYYKEEVVRVIGMANKKGLLYLVT